MMEWINMALSEGIMNFIPFKRNDELKGCSLKKWKELIRPLTWDQDARAYKLSV